MSSSQDTTERKRHRSDDASSVEDGDLMPTKKKRLQHVNSHGVKPLYDARIVFPFPKHLHRVIDIFIKLLKIKPQNKENASEDMIVCIERDQDDGWMVLQPCNVVFTNLLFHCRYPISFEDMDWPLKQTKLYRRVDAKDFLNKMLNFSMSDAVVAEGCFYLVLTQWGGHFYLPEHKIVVGDQFAQQQKANAGLPMEETFETSSSFNYVVQPTMPANGCTLEDDDDDDDDDEKPNQGSDKNNHGFVSIPPQTHGVAYSIRAGHLARMLKLAPEDTTNMRISVNLIEPRDGDQVYTDFLMTMVMDHHVQRYIQRHKTADMPSCYDWSNQKPHKSRSLNANAHSPYPKAINVVMTNLIKIANAFSTDVIFNVHHGKTLCIRTKQVMVDVPGAKGWQFDFMMTGAYDEGADGQADAIDMNDLTQKEMQSWDTMKPKSTIDSHGKIVRHAPIWFDDDHVDDDHGMHQDD